MELDILEKANNLNKKLSRYKMSKEFLEKFKEKTGKGLFIYTPYGEGKFTVPAEFEGRVIDLLQELLDDRIKETEQAIKEL